MGVLMYLAGRQGDVVERDEIIDGVWERPVADDVLTRAIHELRVVFDDDPHQPNYIQTIPKIGYRMVANVAVHVSDGQETPKVTLDEQRRKQSTETRFRYKFLGLFSALAGLVAVVTVALNVLQRDDFGTQVVHNDRVVLAAFENLTDNPRLGRALDIAFRTGIEQSVRINILPPNTLVSALVRMGRNRDDSVDRLTAIEISLREQAKAVIVGTIANIGDSYAVSGEILEPQTGQTIFVHQSTVDNENEILAGLDDVVAAIRRESGEAMYAIDEYSLPLERVTTANFEALEAYSIGVQTAGTADLDVAIPFFEEAIRLDPEFAMAYAKLGFLLLVISDDSSAAESAFEAALLHRDRLTRREQLYVEALRVREEVPSVQKEAWNLLIHAYPNYGEAYRSLGNILHRYDGNYRQAAKMLQIAVELPDPWNSVGHHNLGFAQLALGHFEDAISNFERAWSDSGHPMGLGLGIAYIAAKRYSDADEFLSRNLNFPARNVRHTVELTKAIFFLDQGRFVEALNTLRRAELTAADDTSASHRTRVSRCAVLEQTGDEQALRECLKSTIESESALLSSAYFRRQYWPKANVALLGTIAARNGMLDQAQATLDLVLSIDSSDEYFFVESYTRVLEAEVLMGSNRYEAAIDVLRPLMTKRGIFQARESLARAYTKAGQIDQAITQYMQVLEARGQAFSEKLSRRFGNEFHILDWTISHLRIAELLETQGRHDEALGYYQALVTHWGGADMTVPAIVLATRRIEALRLANDAPET